MWTKVRFVNPAKQSLNSYSIIWYGLRTSWFVSWFASRTLVWFHEPNFCLHFTRWTVLLNEFLFMHILDPERVRSPKLWFISYPLWIGSHFTLQNSFITATVRILRFKPCSARAELLSTFYRESRFATQFCELVWEPNFHLNYNCEMLI